MKKLPLFLVLLLLSGLPFISCHKERSCEDCVNGNKSPVANAGSDRSIILPTDSVSLDGSSSSDPDGTIGNFVWSKISGPASSTINNAASATTTVKNLVAGIYQFELKVRDNGGLSAKDTIVVTVGVLAGNNHPPVADAGADHAINLPINTVTINGSGSADPDNNIVSYQWTKVSGPSTSNIAAPNSVQTNITSLVEGVYQFELKVTDGGGLFSKDTINVNVNAERLLTQIILTGLKWQFWHDDNDPFHAFDEIFLGIADTGNVIPDVLTSNFRVWVKRDPASNWEEASHIILNGNCTAPFWYDLVQNGLLIELCFPWDLNLVGKIAEVKIEF